MGVTCVFLYINLGHRTHLNCHICISMCSLQTCVMGRAFIMHEGLYACIKYTLMYKIIHVYTSNRGTFLKDYGNI